MVDERDVTREALSDLGQLDEVVEMGEQTHDHGVDRPTVEQLEETLTFDPTNLEKQEDLAEALLKRYLHKGRSEQDIERLKRLLAKVPRDRALFERAYIAWRDRKDNDAVEKLHTCVIQMSEARDEPLTSDELWNWVFPFMTDPLRVYGDNWQKHSLVVGQTLLRCLLCGEWRRTISS